MVRWKARKRFILVLWQCVHLINKAGNWLLGDSGGVVNSLDFCPASLKSLGCFYFRCILSSQCKAVTVNFTLPTLKAFFEARRHNVSGNKQYLVARALGCPKTHFFPATNSRSSDQPQNDAKTLFSTLHPLSTVIFATATVLAFVLLRNFNFNFHCYTQREATPTQKSARKCSRDFFRERLQSALFYSSKPASLNRPIRILHQGK